MPEDGRRRDAEPPRRPRRITGQVTSLVRVSRTAARAYGCRPLRAARIARRVRLSQGFTYEEALRVGVLDPAMPESERARYVSRHANLEANARLNNANEEPAITDDKWAFYRHCAVIGIPVPRLLGVLDVRASSRSASGRLFVGRAGFEEMVAHDLPDEFVVKPSNGYEGRGVRAVTRRGGRLHDHSARSLRPGDLWDELCADPLFDVWIVQERLHNHPDLVRLGGDGGLHTVRINTLVGADGEPELLFAFLKLAIGGSAHDNFLGGSAGNAIGELGLRRAVSGRPDAPAGSHRVRAARRQPRHRRAGGGRQPAGLAGGAPPGARRRAPLPPHPVAGMGRRAHPVRPRPDRDQHPLGPPSPPVDAPGARPGARGGAVRISAAVSQARALAWTATRAAERHGVSRLRAARRARRLRVRGGFRYEETLSMGLLDPSIDETDALRRVSDYETAQMLRRLNPESLAALTAEKIIFYRHFAACGIPVPELHGVVGRAGGWSAASGRPLPGPDDCADFLAHGPWDDFVVKPSGGHHGYGVRVLIREGPELVDLEGRRSTPTTLTAELLADPEFDLFVVQERLRNHERVQALLRSETLQTVRVTSFVSDEGVPQVLHAYLRLAAAGLNIDNVRGGALANAAAEVDVATGAVESPAAGGRRGEGDRGRGAAGLGGRLRVGAARRPPPDAPAEHGVGRGAHAARAGRGGDQPRLRPVRERGIRRRRPGDRPRVAARRAGASLGGEVRPGREDGSTGFRIQGLRSAPEIGAGRAAVRAARQSGAISARLLARRAPVPLLVVLVAAWLLMSARPAEGAPVRAAGGPQVTVITRGLQIPWDIAFLPDGRALVSERPGACAS